MKSSEQLIEQAIKGSICRKDVESLCVTRSVEIGELYNEIALLVAKRFHSGAMSYEDADAAMNAIFAMMVDDAANGKADAFIEPAFSIYIAFDEGEYEHHEGEDPVEKYTRPAIRDLLNDARQRHAAVAQ